MTSLQIWPACSEFSAVPSMTSLPKSPASGAVNFCTTFIAASFTLASSVPRMAWTLGTEPLLAPGGGGGFACEGHDRKGRHHVCERLGMNNELISR